VDKRVSGADLVQVDVGQLLVELAQITFHHNRQEDITRFFLVAR
jgi:hypothetical protein